MIEVMILASRSCEGNAIKLKTVVKSLNTFYGMKFR